MTLSSGNIATAPNSRVSHLTRATKPIAVVARAQMGGDGLEPPTLCV
jgi:hypothetical protein